MLEVLSAMGADWYSRTEIATYLGKNKLAPFDIAVLELLAEQGIIKRRLVPSNKENVSRVEYCGAEVKKEAKRTKRTPVGPGERPGKA